MSRSTIGSAISGLTTRGRCFGAAGVATIASALLVGERDLLRVGVLLVALPVAAVLFVTRTRYRVSCTRSLDPPRVAVGGSARVVLRLGNLSRLPTGALLMEDELPYSLGTRPRFALDRIEPRGVREVAYSVRSELRGHFRLGPPSVRLADPFGLCEVSRNFSCLDQLLVTPALTALPVVRFGSDWGGGGGMPSRLITSAGEDDTATREYRQGDDLRKVHWRSTARTGELMVRREEQPRQNSATLFVDTRARAHRGDGPGSSFEWTVSAAASVGAHLALTGYPVSLLTDTSERAPVGAGTIGETVLLDMLALVERSAGTTLTPALEELRRSSDGLVVAVVGSLSTLDADALAQVRRGTTTCVVVLVDSAAWVASSARVRAETNAVYRATSLLLSAAGWRVLEAGSGSTLAQLWPGAGGRAPALSGASG